MGILDRIIGKNRAIPATATFRITEEGKDKLQEFNGDAQCRILVALETRGSCTVTEIANASKVSRGQVERLVPVLVDKGCIQYVNASASTMSNNITNN